MDKSSHTSKFSKFVKGLKGTLNRQKTVGKEDRATPSGSYVVNDQTSCSRSRLPLPLPPVTDIICQLPYYHPHLTNKDDLTNFMSQYNLQEGYFLLRKSFKDPNSYTITVNHRSGLKHIRVMIINGRFSLKDRCFDTIDEMIQYYSHREIPNEENISGVLLRFPIRRPPVEFGDYIVVSDGKQGVPTPAPTTPAQDLNLGVNGKQYSPYDRPHPPIPRPPVVLPLGDGHSTTSRNGSLSDSSISLPAAPSWPLVREQTVLNKSSYNGSTLSTPIGPHLAYDPIPPKPIGPPSAYNPIPPKPIGPPLAYDQISSKPICPPSTNNPNLSAPVGQPAQPVGRPDTPLDDSPNERCDCGLLLRDAALPLGWSVHISQDSDTRGQPFFMSPSDETQWDLPLAVALLLSSEQQNFIRNLGLDSDIKAGDSKALQPGRAITNPRGCPSVRLEEATSTNTWVPCNDYESSKSLREALQRPDEYSPCSRNAPNDD